jgi:hypothetical protein
MLMSYGDHAATLVYVPNGFRVIKSGNFVACAVTGEPIPLEALRYWSVDRQEAYATPEIATRRMLGQA